MVRCKYPSVVAKENVLRRDRIQMYHLPSSLLKVSKGPKGTGELQPPGQISTTDFSKLLHLQSNHRVAAGHLSAISEAET